MRHETSKAQDASSAMILSDKKEQKQDGGSSLKNPPNKATEDAVIEHHEEEATKLAQEYSDKISDHSEIKRFSRKTGIKKNQSMKKQRNRKTSRTSITDED